MTRILSAAVLALFFILPFAPFAAPPSAHAVDRSKQWALYSWVDNGQWHYSLIHATQHHPDDSEVKASGTDSVEAIETRISLLEQGSDVTLNPLPVLNMELHRPPYTTLKEFERVCDNAKVSWDD